MQWIKERIGYPQSGDADPRTSPTGPVFPTAPPGSMHGDNYAQSGGQSFDAQPSSHNAQPGPGGPAHQYDAYDAPNEPSSSLRQQEEAGEREGNESTERGGQPDEEVLTGEQTLVRISGSVVHLVDDEESILLAQGDFSLQRIMQEGMEALTIAQVGEELKWPVVQKGSTVKLDRTHYFFAVEVPAGTDESSSEMDTLSYGLTIPHGTTAEDDARVQELDHYLDRYSTFSTPTIVTGDVKDGSARSEVLGGDHASAKVVPEEKVSGDGTVVADEEESAAFWTTIAPNVNDYNGKAAKFVATGTGHLIEDIFWLSDAAMAQLDAGHGYMKSKFQPARESSNVNPSTIGAMRGVRKVTETTDQVAAGILGGILRVTGSVADAVVSSGPGQKVFSTAPGQVALASMEAFGSLFDAIERAGRNVMAHSSSVTQDFVNHRYGESARQLTDESLKSVGHVASVAWSVVKLHKAFTPTAFAKSSAKSAVTAHKRANVPISEQDPHTELKTD